MFCGEPGNGREFSSGCDHPRCRLVGADGVQVLSGRGTEDAGPGNLESWDTIGGVWAYTNDVRFGGVMTTTETTSSRCVTEISDFPMPYTYPEFPSHVQIFACLKDYCVRFDLDRHIRLDHQVSNARKVRDTWHVTCVNGFECRAKNLIVSSGVHQHPNEVSNDVRFSRFARQIIHSAAVKQVPPDIAGKTGVIWGGGESASNIAFEISRMAARIYW